GRGCREHIQPSPSEVLQGLAAYYHMEGGPSLTSCLREGQRSRWEIERRQADSSGQLRASVEPLEATRDHQVQHQEPILFQGEHQTLSDSLDPEDSPPLGFLDRRFDATEQEGRSKPNAFDRLPPNPLLEAVLVEQDIGEFGHGFT